MSKQNPKAYITRQSPTCIYLSDGTKIIIKRDPPDLRGKVWMERVEQTKIRAQKLKPHKTVLVQYDKMSAEIDKEIANIILLCWKLGIKTLNSCQHHNMVPVNMVWVEFDKTSIDKFLTIVQKYASLNNPFGAWHFSGYPDIILDGSGNITWPIQYELNISVYFPRKDLDLVENALNSEFNQILTQEKCSINYKEQTKI